jgi:hypothetical protein
VICQLSHQAPKAIVHRGAPESFEFSDLRGKVVVAPRIGGSAPYTVTAGLVRERTDRVEELRDRFTRFTACIDAAMTVLPTTSAETIDSILTARWPEGHRHPARDATAQMTVSTVWETVAIDPAASDRWMRMIAEAAMITRACSTEAGGFGRAAVAAGRGRSRCEPLVLNPGDLHVEPAPAYAPRRNRSVSGSRRT